MGGLQIEQGLGRWSEELRHKRQAQGSKHYEVVVGGGESLPPSKGPQEAASEIFPRL